MKRALLIAAGGALLLASPARAWRETGHFTVCEIAGRHLNDSARKAVSELLGKPDFAEQCTWPDTVRKSTKWKHTYGWHFINLDDGESYPEVIASSGDAVQALILNEDVLRDPAASKEEKAAALKFFAHITGDLHQPLHVGRKSNRGGNDVTVSWFGVTDYFYEEILDDRVVKSWEPINLHKVWDLHLLQHFIVEEKLEDGTLYKHKAYADFMDREASPEMDLAWQKATYLDWARESLAQRGKAYNVGNGRLGEFYYVKNIALANERILMAGRRLAGALNRILSGALLRPQDRAMREQIRKALGKP